jgi:hypothetical protein
MLPCASTALFADLARPPVCRVGTAKEIGNAVAFFITKGSPVARQAIGCDGGIHLS